MHGHLGYQRRAMGLQDRTFSFALHGEARHNEFIRDGRDTEGRALLDPALTEAGEAQAAASHEAMARRVRALILAAGDATSTIS